MSKIKKSVRVLELEDKLYDLAISLRLSKSKKDIKSDDIADQLTKTKGELEELGWKSDSDFDEKYQRELLPEDYIGLM